MGRYVDVKKEQQDAGYGSRRHSIGGVYHPYIPDKLSELTFTPDESTAVALADATEVVSRVDEYIKANRTTGVLSILSKSESIASSLMEDIGSSTHNIIFALDVDDIRNDTIRSIIKNINLTDETIGRFGDTAQPITVSDIIELQAGLVQYTSQGTIRGTEFAGIKTAQNRIGGNNLFDATFIPTPPQYMDEYLNDLVTYINHHGHTNPIVAAAFVHAQFETLHPFPDGNGRTGRAIIQGMLRRDGVVRYSVFPISTVLKERADDYIGGLNSFRYDGLPQPNLINNWIKTFSYALADAAELAKVATDQIIELRADWRTRLSDVRSDAVDHQVVDYVLENLSAHSGSLAKRFGVSQETARNSLKRLEELGILESRNRERRRVFYAPAAIDIIDSVEVKFRPATTQSKFVPSIDVKTTQKAPRLLRCGCDMPNSRVRCNLRLGHPGHHQHK